MKADESLSIRSRWKDVTTTTTNDIAGTFQTHVVAAIETQSGAAAY